MSKQLEHVPKPVKPQKQQRKARPKVLPDPEWVKADYIAALFDCSVEAVYRGLLGLDKIPRVDLNWGNPDRERPAFRFNLAAARAHSQGMLAEWEAERKREEESLKQLRESPFNRGRRSA